MHFKNMHSKYVFVIIANTNNIENRKNKFKWKLINKYTATDIEDLKPCTYSTFAYTQHY